MIARILKRTILKYKVIGNTAIRIVRTRPARDSIDERGSEFLDIPLS